MSSARHVFLRAGDDVRAGRPDPDVYMAASLELQRPPLRCVVIGASNAAVEAARTIGMRCVAVASRLKMYELTAADLVVKDLEALTLQNLKQLFQLEEGRQPMLQEDADEQAAKPRTSVGLIDR